MRHFIAPTTLFLLIAPLVVSAQNLTYLVQIPVGSSDTFGGYINALYLLAISIAAILAVIKLIIAGVKYMLTDVVTSKADAKNDIKGALLGLLLIISAVLILTVINENIIDNEVTLDPVASQSTPNTTNPSSPGNNTVPTTTPTTGQPTGPTGGQPTAPINSTTSPTSPTLPTGGQPTANNTVPACIGTGFASGNAYYFPVSNCTNLHQARLYIQENYCLGATVYNGGNGNLYCIVR